MRHTNAVLEVIALFAYTVKLKIFNPQSTEQILRQN
jgi:hypothetical protein